MFSFGSWSERGLLHRGTQLLPHALKGEGVALARMLRPFSCCRRLTLALGALPELPQVDEAQRYPPAGRAASPAAPGERWGTGTRCHLQALPGIAAGAQPLPPPVWLHPYRGRILLLLSSSNDFKSRFVGAVGLGSPWQPAAPAASATEAMAAPPARVPWGRGISGCS